MTRILIADDHRLLRDALRGLLEAEPDLRVCGEAADGSEVVRRVQQLQPDILLLDISMPGVNGIDALRALDEPPSRMRVLLLTAAIDREQLVAALQLGARGVVMKDAPGTMLVRAIRAVAAGQIWVGRERVATLIDALRSTSQPVAPAAVDDRLTPRELVIVAGVVAAFSNRDIALDLNISEKTVKRHLTNIFDKLGVSSRVELAMFAVRRGLTLPPFPTH